jgi:hypothetical protein
MALERVYHPETCEPFDVPPYTAERLRLYEGWTTTAWAREEAPERAVQDTVPAATAEWELLTAKPSHDDIDDDDYEDLYVDEADEPDEGPAHDD